MKVILNPAVGMTYHGTQKPKNSKTQKIRVEGTAHKGLNSPKRFTNLLRVNVINFELLGLMHQYGSLGVPQTQKSCDAMIDHKICVKISCMFAPILPKDLL